MKSHQHSGHPLRLIYQGSIPVHSRDIGASVFPIIPIPQPPSFPASGEGYSQPSASIGGSTTHEKIVEIESYAKQGKRVIEIRVMDSIEPLFYYVCLLDETSFYSLSKNQNILVGFEAFPAKLVDFFNLVKDPQSRFVAIWEDHESSLGAGDSTVSKNGQLSVIETNSFKHIVHVSLPCILASDEHMKIHLANINTAYREELYTLRSKCEELNRVNASLEQERNKVKSELDRTRLSSMEQLQEIRQQYAPELQALSSSSLGRALDDLALQYEREKRQFEVQYQDRIKVLSDKCALLEGQQNVLTVLKRNLESTLADLTCKFTDTQSEMFKYKAELLKFRDSDTVIPEMEREMIRLRERIRDLEQEKSERDDLIKKRSYDLQSLSEQYQKSDEQLQQLRQQQQQMDLSYQQATNELHRQTDMIERLQQEVRSLKSKSKSKSQQIEEKETLIQLQKSQLGSLQKEIDQLLAALKSKDEQLSKAVNDLNFSKTVIEEMNEKLQSNEKTLNWFYKTSSTGVPLSLNRNQALSAIQSPPMTTTMHETSNVKPGGLTNLRAYQPKTFPTSFGKFPETPLQNAGITLGDSVSPPESIPSPPDPSNLPLPARLATTGSGNFVQGTTTGNEATDRTAQLHRDNKSAPLGASAMV
jgi:spindle assembly abnormal protein 6